MLDQVLCRWKDKLPVAAVSAQQSKELGGGGFPQTRSHARLPSNSYLKLQFA